MNHTLALDALLTDPRATEIVAALHELLPTALADQVQAAGAHASSARKLAAAFMGADPKNSRYMAARDIPEWIRLGAFDALARWFDGTADTCMHCPVPEQPQPINAVAWKPGLVVCLQCTHLLKCRPGSLEERTCDACGHECTGPEHDDGIWPGLTQAGVLLYEYGVCGDCKATITEAVAQ